MGQRLLSVAGNIHTAMVGSDERHVEMFEGSGHPTGFDASPRAELVLEVDVNGPEPLRKATPAPRQSSLNWLTS